MSIFGSSDGSAPRLKPLPSKRSHVVSVLDIVSTKVVCLIARLTPREASEFLPGRTHKIEIIGIGHQRSRGIKSGVISDLDALEGVIRHAVDTAERQADLTVDSLILCTAKASRTELYDALALRRDEWAGRGIGKVVRVGECLAPRYLADAIFDGHRVGREFDDDEPERPRAIIRERQIWGAETFPKLGDAVR